MEPAIFQDLIALMPQETKLPQVLWKHANERQKRDLVAQFPEVYLEEENDDNETVKQTAPDTLQVEETLWGYGHEASAEQDARQFMQPLVFTYRSALFPNPMTHGVTVQMDSATPVEDKRPKRNPLYPWGIKLVMSVTGKGEKPQQWVQRFKDRARISLNTR